MKKKEFQQHCNSDIECNNGIHLKCLQLNEHNAKQCNCEGSNSWDGHKCRE